MDFVFGLAKMLSSAFGFHADLVARTSGPSSEPVAFVCHCCYCVSHVTDAKDIYTAVSELYCVCLNICFVRLFH